MSGQQEAVAEASSFVTKINNIILFPLIALLLSVAFLIFLWGCAQYVMNASNDKGREEGVKHITWGIIGFVVMLSAWAILEIATATFGIDDELACAQNPKAAGCESKFKMPADVEYKIQ